MVKFGKYVLVYDIHELKKNVVWEKENSICVEGMGVFHDVNETTTFPHTFKYFESCWDTHFCGDYFSCDKAEMIQAVEMEVSRIKHRIEECKKVIDFLKS